MDNTEESVPVRSTHLRVSQACQRCRTLKTRCLPSEQSGTCRRCFTAKRECIWADVPRRPRRARGPSRISQVEQKIDGLVASLVKPNVPGASGTPNRVHEDNRSTIGTQQLAGRDRPVAPGSWLPFPESFEEDTPLPYTQEQADTSVPPDNVEVELADNDHDLEYLGKLRNIHDFADRDDSNNSTNSSLYHRKPEPAIDDRQVKDILSNGRADTLLKSYRAMCITFPFVPLEDSVSAADLHTFKPMLFLAMITVAAWDDHKLQLHLDRVFRTELANHTYIRPRRTLSLLQSVLVYLSRYHFVFSHKTQQIYFMQTTANGLAIDLGLHRESSSPILGFPGRPKPPQFSVTDQLERQRTFLGCYYLSSLISGGMQKPNLLKYTDYMGQCCHDLRDYQQYPSDKIIPHLLALRRLDDQIQDAFFTDETVGLAINDPRISMNFRLLESQLDEWRREKHTGEYQILLDLSSAFTDMQLHSVALRPQKSSNQGFAADGTRLNALLATLEACKRYFDTFLACPASRYHVIGFSEWFRIPNVVMTLAKLCIPSDAHYAAQWDVKAAHERGRLDLYLESLCYRMKSLSTYKKTQNFHSDFYWALEMIMDLTKTWFMKKINDKTASYDTETPDTVQSLSHGILTESSIASSTPSLYGETGCPHAPQDPGPMLNCNNGADPFAFMRDMDFDMDKFFDVGLWGDESYLGMGFGGGMN